MLKIRFSRKGKKNSPTYRVVVSEHTKDTFADVTENLGFYNPRTKEVGLNADRIKYWISVGAQPSATVHNLLVSQGIIEAKKTKASSLSKVRSAKIAEKVAVENEENEKKAEKEKAAKEEAKAAKAAEAKVEDAPKEEEAKVEEKKEEVVEEENEEKKDEKKEEEAK